MRTNKPFSPTLLHSIQVTLKKKCRPAISRPPPGTISCRFDMEAEDCGGNQNARGNMERAL